jgi:hypothetical protein
MSTSLKALIPPLAKLWGLNPNALYERQRALIRAGLLEARPGRGPGSGVEASPESVAMLLISVLATDSLSEVEEKTRLAADLRDQNDQAVTFAQVLATTIGSWGGEDSFLSYLRSSPIAILHLGESHRIFGRHSGAHQIHVEVQIVPAIIEQTAKELANAR